MQINFLKKVVEKAAGEQAVKIVGLLFNKKNINEFLIAKKLGLTINQTRNLLYRLSHLGIISSIRKKDKRKGWYIYFWTFNIQRSLEILEEELNMEISKLSAESETKKKMRFYKCPVCGRQSDEEAALLSNFLCSECGEVFVLADNAPFVQKLEEQIAKLKIELQHVASEISKVQAEKDKSLVRSLKREAIKKKKERQEKREALAKLLAKSKKAPKKDKKRLSKKKQ